MAIETTLGALKAADTAIARLLELRLGGARTYQIAKLARLVRAETAHFDAERHKAIQECGTSRATVTPAEKAQFGETLTEVTAEKREEYFKRIEDLSNVPVTLEWTPLVFGEDLQLSGAEILALGPLLVESGAPTSHER